MALAKTIPFSKFVVSIGTGEEPTEVFIAPCAFQSRSFVRNKNLQEIVIPDCSDEDAPGWIYRDPLSIGWGVTGEGVLDEDSIEPWDIWFLLSDTRKVRIAFTALTGTVTTRSYIGEAHLQTLTFAANRAERVTFNVDIAGSGPLTETPAPVVESVFMDQAKAAEAEATKRAKGTAKAGKTKEAA